MTDSEKRKRRRNKRRSQQNQTLDRQRVDHLLTDPRVLDDPHVQALLVRGQNAKNSREMLEVHLMLDRFLLERGSLLEDPSRSVELSDMRGRAEQRDKDEVAFERDRAGFIEDVFRRSEGIKFTGDKAARVKAQAMQMYKAARENKIALRHNKELQVDHMIEAGPKMSVNATGYWLQIGSAPNVQRVLKPDVVRVMHRSWTLNPGLNENVPEIFVRQYELLQKSRMETQERQQAMSATKPGGSMNATLMEQKLNEIDRKYGVKRQLLGQGA
jgi:hypothetical protein